MHLLTYHIENEDRPGFLLGDQVVDLRRAWALYGRHEPAQVPPPPGSIDSLLWMGAEGWRWAEAVIEFTKTFWETDTGQAAYHDMVLSASGITFRPPILHPGKVICVGMNYPGPEADSQAEPSFPILFHKAATALTGHRTSIVLPQVSERVLYEGELAVVIGRRAKNVPEAEALSVVAGYTVANDVGAQDVEQRTSQWTSGKMFDTFCPLGPTLVSRDEIGDPGKLRLQTTLNGEVVQESGTGAMFFGVAFLVHYISTLTTLEPGDLMLTGSPKLAGARPDPRTPLKDGDTIRVDIEGVGVLENWVEDERDLTNQNQSQLLPDKSGSLPVPKPGLGAS